MPTPNLHKPTKYLQQLGQRRAPHGVWAELMAATGFTVYRIDAARSHVQHGEIVVAAIVGDESAAIEIEADGITKVEPLLTPISEPQRAVLELLFDKIDLDANAVHEAGHAVAAHELNREFCYIRLSVTDNEMAWCKDDGPDELNYTDDPQGVIDVQTVLAAGVAAEKLLLGWHREDGCEKDRIDVDVIETFKLQYADGPPNVEPHVFDEYIPLAMEVLTADRVRAVADALKAKMFLSRVEIENILDDFA